MHVFGVHLLGIDLEHAKKLGITVLFIVAALLSRFVVVLLLRAVPGQRRNTRLVFWTRQAANVIAALVIAVAIVSIWFDDPQRWATAAGLVSAGIAFALQKVITALAGYIVILRGKTFNVGDRITMGGVRGDVIALGFIQTTILEMGQPPSVEPETDPAMWVHSRQFTGRVVTVTNDKIFDEPVFNYSRVFPFLWEEMRIPIAYDADRERAEKILLECVGRETDEVHDVSRDELAELERKYSIRVEDMTPHVFYRLTDNWLELTVRFVVPTHDIRFIKDAISRAILRAFDEAKIGIASSTYDIVGFPPVRIDDASLRRLARIAREDGAGHAVEGASDSGVSSGA